MQIPVVIIVDRAYPVTIAYVTPGRFASIAVILVAIVEGTLQTTDDEKKTLHYLSEGFSRMSFSSEREKWQRMSFVKWN